MEKTKKIDLTVSACIIFDGKILLMHHKKLDKWLFPGGHIDPNETPDGAILREVKEETGLNLIFVNFSELSKSPEEIEKLAIPFHANLHNVGDHDHYCSYYLGNVDNPNLVKNHESKDLKWFDIEEVKKLENLLPSIKKMAIHAIEKHNELKEKSKINIS